MMQGVICEGNMEWLFRSIDGETFYPVAIDIMTTKLTNEWVSTSNVRDTGNYKALVSLISKIEMEEAMEIGGRFRGREGWVSDKLSH